MLYVVFLSDRSLHLGPLICDVSLNLPRVVSSWSNCMTFGITQFVVCVKRVWCGLITIPREILCGTLFLRARSLGECDIECSHLDTRANS